MDDRAVGPFCQRFFFSGGGGGEPRARGKTHRLMASRNMLCSRSVHDSLLLVIVYGLRVFDASGFFMVDGRGRSRANPSRKPRTGARARGIARLRKRACARRASERLDATFTSKPTAPNAPRGSRARVRPAFPSPRARGFRELARSTERRRVRIRANGRARERNRATLSLTAGRWGALETDARLSDVRSLVVQLCRRPDAA